MSLINKVVKVTDKKLGGHPIGTVGVVIGENTGGLVSIYSVLVAKDKDVIKCKWHKRSSLKVIDEVNPNSIFTIVDGEIVYKGCEF